MMKKVVFVCFMLTVVFMRCVGMASQEQEMCCICREEFNYEKDDLIYIDGCGCSDSAGAPFIRVYHESCFGGLYRDARYGSGGGAVKCCYCSHKLSTVAMCYLCPKLLTKESDSIEIYGCSCGIPHKGHRSCFKKGYCYAKCNNTEIICSNCQNGLVLRAKELVSYENDVVCSLCLESLKDESNIIQTYGCSCWEPRVYHNACHEDLSKKAHKCPECKDWLDYKAEVSLLHDGKQLSCEEITRKLKKNFSNNMKCGVIRGVGVVLLASFPFWAISMVEQYYTAQ